MKRQKALDPRIIEPGHPGLLQSVLVEVNTARRALGKHPLKRLPAGIPGSERQCPIARALDGGHVQVSGPTIQMPSMKQAYLVAHAWGAEVLNNEGEVDAPGVIDEFVSAFDHWGVY
jgi:hypothetical protein